MRLTKITTKTGDSGLTLFAGSLLAKSDTRIELLGTLDELNCLIGNIPPKYSPKYIQDHIFEISAAIYKQQKWHNADKYTWMLETDIEFRNSGLKSLKEFIYPSGNIHLARAVCRRSERLAWACHVDIGICVYLNRLSDYLFVLARVDAGEVSEWDRFTN